MAAGDKIPQLRETRDKAHPFERQRLHTEGYELKPSELFRRQCHPVGWFDVAGLMTRNLLGRDNLLWSTNFALATSTWPESRKTIARCFDGVPEDERRRVLVDNAARLYKLPSSASSNGHFSQR